MLQNITLSARKNLIDRARRRAKLQKTTLNAEFRRWLEQYTEAPQTVADLSALMDRFSYAKTGKSFTRDELNER
ncbi:MAG TPA: hypothetical protein PKK59_11100 [Anaerolineaceae bacterium]|nr:hypothetical protein [Anaerolineaceae bacterium]